MSCPARIAFSIAGRTVSLVADDAGEDRLAGPRRAIRLARSSSLTVRGRQPEARRSPSVVGGRGRRGHAVPRVAGVESLPASER